MRWASFSHPACRCKSWRLAAGQAGLLQPRQPLLSNREKRARQSEQYEDKKMHTVFTNIFTFRNANQHVDVQPVHTETCLFKHFCSVKEENIDTNLLLSRVLNTKLIRNLSLTTWTALLGTWASDLATPDSAGFLSNPFAICRSPAQPGVPKRPGSQIRPQLDTGPPRPPLGSIRLSTGTAAAAARQRR